MKEELLIILIIIVTVVINIYKAVKKKDQAKRNAPAGQPMEGEEKHFQEMLKRLLDEKPEESLEETLENNPTPAESLETLTPLGGNLETLEDYAFKEPEYSTPSITMEGFDVTPSIIVEETVTGKDKPSVPGEVRALAESFDLRTAVIYHTILTRPYN